MDARLETTVRERAPLSLTADERTELLGRISETRAALTLLLGRTHEKASAPVTLGHYRSEVRDGFIPLLEAFSELLNRK